MFLKRIVFTLPLLIFFSANAETNKEVVTDIETILVGNCLDSYNKKYHKFKDNKAFALARDKNGKTACSWTYKSSSAKKAKSNVIKRCEKNRIKRKVASKCVLVDVNSEIVAQKGSLPEVVKPGYTALTEKDKAYKELHEKAMPILGSKYCRKIFRKYLTLKGHKVFTHTTSKEGFYGVCSYKNLSVPNQSEKLALEKCQKKKMSNPYSKKLTPNCKVFAVNNTIKVSRKDYGLPPFELNLMTAAERMHLDTVKKLVEEGADLEMTNEKGHTPLVHAIRSRRLEVVKYLVEQGAEINTPSKYGRLPLKFAIVAKRNDDVIKYLKSKGAKEKL